MTVSLAHIYRHPIKSHGSERLDHVTLTQDQTLPWDRVWGVAHTATDIDGSDWAHCRNFTRGAANPALMAIKAQFDETSQQITLTHPDLEPLTANPDTDCPAIIAWVSELAVEGRAGPARVLRAATSAQGRGFTDQSDPYISILNLTSLRVLSQKAGREMSPLRFRGNLWIDGAAPWEEFDWVGKRLSLGGAILQVEERIDRCRATEANPDTGKRDTNTLALLEDGWDHRDFGVFARVVQSGPVAVGDTLKVLQ